MRLVTKQEALKRIQSASSVAEIEVKSAADLSRLTADVKQQGACVVLVCLK